MSNDIALSAFSSKHASEEHAKIMQEKLEAAKSFLGERWLLAKPLKKLKKKRSY